MQEIKLSNFVNLSKKEIGNLVDVNIDTWCESGEDTLLMLSMLAKIDLYVSECKQKLAKRVYEEVAKYGKEGVAKNGVKFSLFASSKYDYSNSDAWNVIKSQIEPLSKTLKEVETIAKATKQRTSWISEEGEEFTIYPAICSSTETTKSSIL